MSGFRKRNIQKEALKKERKVALAREAKRISRKEKRNKQKHALQQVLDFEAAIAKDNEEPEIEEKHFSNGAVKAFISEL